MRPQVPGVSSRYVLEEEVGRGGMAIVYRAQDTALGRDVAVKVLHAHLQSQPEARLRAAREARAVAKLQHPNIVEIYDYSGEDAEQGYLVTEYIQGVTLEEMLGRRRLELPETGLLIALPICEALAHAHALGVLHRDIKPGNAMIRDDGIVKLMDFGIAQILDAQDLTVTGTLLGSPAHMSPEHMEGQPLDNRADVFSLGTVLYRLTVGELPFSGRNAPAVMRAILAGEYRSPQAANPCVSAPLERILRRCLEKDPDRRYDGVEHLLIDLRAYLVELEIRDPGAELKAFFTDPDGYESALRARLVKTRLRRGREAMTRRRHAEALEHLNQVLAIDPRNLEVLGLLARLGRRRVWRGALVGTVAAASAAAAVWGLWPSEDIVPTPRSRPGAGPTAVPPATRPPPTVTRVRAPRTELADPPPAPLRAANSEKGASVRRTETRRAASLSERRVARARPLIRRPRRTVAAAPSRHARLLRPRRRLARLVRGVPTPELRTAAASPAEEPVAEPVVPGPRPKVGTAIAEPPSKPPPAPDLPVVPRWVKINTWPKAVEIFVDGKRIGWAGIVNQVELLPGRHRIRLTSPSCHPKEIAFDVPPHGKVAPIVARLRWKPGLLVVENEQKADVAVDGVYKGTADRTRRDPILVHIDRANPLGRLKVHLRISKPGYRQVDRVEEVAAGRRKVVRVLLKRL